MTIPFSEIRQRWREDPENRAAEDELAFGFALEKELIGARVRAGLSQEDVARRMGTSQSTVARLESRHKPSLRSLERFAEATGSRLVIRLEARADHDA